MKQQPTISNIRLQKFVHGGQTLGQLPDGKTVFVWGGLPGELVSIRVLKSKSSYAEGIVEEVTESSPDRVDPLEPSVYLSTSPWQNVAWEAENKAKQEILSETFTRGGLNISWEPFIAAVSDEAGGVYHYRNKMEFSFFGDDKGLHLAHYVRGSHGKQVTDGSVLAMEPINIAARAIVAELNRLKIWGGDLKTVLVRCSQDGATAAALFIKKEALDLQAFVMPTCLQGMDIYYSNPQSPASVPTKKLVTFGDTTLTDKVGKATLQYSVLSFFQVTIPVFERALASINKQTSDTPKIDMYSGVGSIGLGVGDVEFLVELDEANVAMAKENVKGTQTQVVQASSEAALEYIDGDHAVIVDPPRAGLHEAVVHRLLEALPPKIVYLSCNPSTQARDVALLLSGYKIVWAEGFNFFPRTPHIESLIVLERNV